MRHNRMISVVEFWGHESTGSRFLLNNKFQMIFKVENWLLKSDSSTFWRPMWKSVYVSQIQIYKKKNLKHLIPFDPHPQNSHHWGHVKAQCKSF